MEKNNGIQVEDVIVDMDGMNIKDVVIQEKYLNSEVINNIVKDMSYFNIFLWTDGNVSSKQDENSVVKIRSILYVLINGKWEKNRAVIRNVFGISSRNTITMFCNEFIVHREPPDDLKALTHVNVKICQRQCGIEEI